ncbi:hypothetical protein JHK87_050698 [Glycine soja]|nr:hypothetical protein JHK87_050698 [Glycine soja]
MASTPFPPTTTSTSSPSAQAATRFEPLAWPPTMALLSPSVSFLSPLSPPKPPEVSAERYFIDKGVVVAAKVVLKLKFLIVGAIALKGLGGVLFIFGSSFGALLLNMALFGDLLFFIGMKNSIPRRVGIELERNFEGKASNLVECSGKSAMNVAALVARHFPGIAFVSSCRFYYSASFHGHEKFVSSLAFSYDGHCLASGGLDEIIKVKFGSGLGGIQEDTYLVFLVYLGKIKQTMDKAFWDGRTKNEAEKRSGSVEEERGKRNSYQYVGRTTSVRPTASLGGTKVSVDEIQSVVVVASFGYYLTSLHRALVGLLEPDPRGVCSCS